MPISSARLPAADGEATEVVSSQLLTSNRGQRESGRVKNRCIQSQPGRRLSWAAIHRSVAFFTTGRVSPAVAGVGDVFYLVATGIIAAIFLHAADAGAAGEHFGDGFHFDIAQTTGVEERRPALVGR